MLYTTSQLRFRAVCPDGKVRTARPTAEADTFFTIPARVTAHGRTVSGFVERVGRKYIFYPRGANADAAGGRWK